MSIVHYSGPAAPRVTRPAPLHLVHDWFGWDDTQWNLCGGNIRTGVVLRAGVRGLTTPTRTHYTAKSPALAGQRHMGFRTEPRDVFWPLLVKAPESDWYDYDRAWWRTMHPARPGVWRVSNPINGAVRELSCRFVDDGDHAVEMDPGLTGWEMYGVRLVADDPFWRGPWVVRQFDNTTTDGDFFNGGAAPPFFISSSSQSSQARIDNPGDEASYLVYILHGPFDSAEVGIGSPGPKTQYLATVDTGQSVVIDTRPSSPSTARLIPTPTADPGTTAWAAQVFGVEGTNVFANTGTLAMNSPLQPGQERPLTVSMVGAGSVTVAHRPPYWRAW